MKWKIEHSHEAVISHTGFVFGQERNIRYISTENEAFSIEVYYRNWEENLVVRFEHPAELKPSVEEKIKEFTLNLPKDVRINVNLHMGTSVIIDKIEPGYKLNFPNKDHTINPDINTLNLFYDEEGKLKINYLRHYGPTQYCRVRALSESLQSQLPKPLSKEQVYPLFPAIVGYAIQQEYILPLKRNLTGLQSLYQVMMLLEEVSPAFSGLSEVFEELCCKFQFYADQHHISTLFQQGKQDEVLSLLKIDSEQSDTRIWYYSEPYYKHLILGEPLPKTGQCPTFNINTLIEWYQSISSNSSYFSKANHRLYHLYYLTHSDELNSRETKTQLFKFAFRSGDSTLSDKAFNSLCGLELDNQFESIKGEEGSLIKLAHHIYSQNQKIKSLDAKKEENKMNYEPHFFNSTKVTDEIEDKLSLQLCSNL